MAAALTAMQIDRFNLLGTSFGGKVALWLAAQQPERVLGLVLEAPAAIRPVGTSRRRARRRRWRAGSTRIPERLPPLPAADPAIQAKTQCAGDAAARPRSRCRAGSADA